MKISFTWDKNKDILNQKKHKISFEEASSIFSNLPFEVFYDPDHSENENRYIAIGISNKKRILLVIHCESSKENEVRIISARKATKREIVIFLGENK